MLTALVALVALVLAGGVAGAPAADAASSCYSGTVCVVAYRADGSTVVAAATEGNLTDWVGVSYWGGYVWNNGTHLQGADHIQLFVTKSDGQRLKTCLHYGPKTWTGDPTAIFIDPFTTVTSATWRGECAPTEEGWHPA
jgi:hypothetical protein